ncbi:ATP-binding cassette domain-containing protein [Prosthecobacter sp.]|uniref:ATP-binding cassette domain-containing protein n=1 Tax=Prosthecobacter sp. TaxID=1965333 RepID=UPI003784A9C1
MTTKPCLEILNFEAHSKAISMRIDKLEVLHGEFCALVARSGAGKSVLLSIITGHPLGPWMKERNAVSFDLFRVGRTAVSQQTFSSPAHLRAALRDENLVYLPQKLPEDRSMQRLCLSEMVDVVCAVALQCPPDAAMEKLREKCRAFGLENVLEQPLKDLSGGERKRVEIIARLTGVELRDREAGREEVLFLLDEPTTGLDNATQREYFRFLKQTRQLFTDISISFVIATHALSLLEERDEATGEGLFDRVLYVRKEECRGDGPGTSGSKHCQLAFCGSVQDFVSSEHFAELNGQQKSRSTFVPAAAARSQRASVSETASASTAGSAAPVLAKSGGLPLLCSTLRGELRRAYGKQFEGKGKRAVFLIPLLVGLVVFAAFLARNEINPERFIFFSTIYAFWIGIFNSCQIVNGAVASGEWNYWVLAMRRPFFNYIFANALVSFLLSLLQLSVFAAAVLLFSALRGEDSLFNVFVNQSQLPVYFIETVAGLPSLLLVVGLFFSSLLMGALSGTGLGTLISCVAKDTLGALKIAVGIVVVSMVSSTAVLKGDGSAMPVAPPLYLKLQCPAPFLSMPATFYSAQPHAGFWPHLLEDVSFLLPQRYFFNIGRVLDKDVLESSERYVKRNEDFEYKLTGEVAASWQSWKRVTNKETLAQVREILEEENKPLGEGAFPQLLLRIIGLETLACSLLSGLFFLLGTWLTFKNKSNYEIH